MSSVQVNSQIQIVPVDIGLVVYGAHLNMLFVIKVNFSVLIKWSYNTAPKLMLITEPRIVTIF